MKLLNKITLWFIAVVLLLTPISMYISYNNIKNRIDSAETERMMGVNDRVAQQLKAETRTEEYAQGRPIKITALTTPLPDKKVDVLETSYFNNDLKRKECVLTVNSYYQIAGKNYEISSYNYVTKADQILSGMMNALIWKVILIILGVLVTARLLSGHIFSPLRQTMKEIHHFNLKQKTRLKLPETNTNEFKELNTFLQKMTDKAMEDYASVKEFSENASHELQTPLAVISSKLELMAETPITETQAVLIEDMQNAIDKLYRINRSLTLLTRLENQEFEVKENMKFCKLTRDILADYAERITLNNLTVSSKLDENILLKIHPTLAEMLVTNLMSNAIRHNIEGGSINIELSARKFRMSNTGIQPEIPTEEFFKRFKKSNQCSQSIGLGLAIVKQICEISNFVIEYSYQEGWHILTIWFDKNDSIPIQNNINDTSSLDIVVV